MWRVYEDVDSNATGISTPFCYENTPIATLKMNHLHDFPIDSSEIGPRAIYKSIDLLNLEF